MYMSDRHGERDGGGGGWYVCLLVCFASIAMKVTYLVNYHLCNIIFVCTGASKQLALTFKHESQVLPGKNTAPSPSKETVSIASTRPKSGNTKCMIVMKGGGGGRG